MVSMTQGIIAHWLLGDRGTCVNNLPKVVIWKLKAGSRTSDFRSRKSNTQRHQAAHEDYGLLMFVVISNRCSVILCSVCWRYDPQTNRWARAASMSTRRLGVGVAVLNGYLYAVGGSDGTSPLNTGLCVVSCDIRVCLYLSYIASPCFTILKR